MIKILFCILTFTISVQAQIKWNDYMPYSNCNHVAISSKYVFCSSYNGIIRYNIFTEEVSKFSKINGLSDIGISSIDFNTTYDCLIVSYFNGNVDIVIDTIVYNFSEYKNQVTINKLFTTDKGVYFATNSGVLLFNLQYKVFIELCQFKINGTVVKVNDITEKDNAIYAATNKGIFYSNVDFLDLDDFLLWNKISFLSLNYSNIVNYNNVLYSISNNINSSIDTLIMISNSNYTNIDTGSFVNLRISNNNLIFVESDRYTILENSITSTFSNLNINPRDVFCENDSIYWIADAQLGLVKQTSSGQLSYSPNGPNNSKVVSISVEGSKLWVATGGKDGTWSNLWNTGELHTFIDENWQTLNNSTVSGMPNVSDILKVIVNPSNPSQVFAATWGSGLLEFNNKSFVTIYNETNSTLQDLDVWAQHVRTYGLAFDVNNNLWITNSGVQNAISVRTPNNNWYGFQYYGYLNTTIIGDIIVTKNNHKWVVLPRGIGLFAFDDKGTFDNISDDDFRKFQITDDYNQIISNDVYSIAEDTVGQIWVGTNRGIVVYKNPENVFTNQNFYAQRIIVPDSTGEPLGFLLANETITAIEINLKNQKWIGTENSGVFLLSSDGTQEIYHFTKENSPLISNNIYTIAIDDSKKEVFFGTDNGIVSIIPDSTSGLAMINKENSWINIFPNPAFNEVTFSIENQSSTITGSLSIFNSQGALVKVISINNQYLYNKIDVSMWSSGLYYCVFNSAEKSTFNKFIITK
ncbi:MAG: hypothetical protein A2033_09000 [Bacteroidetes bacterium GWA2_31_9]|nr:MAG: hypothetical protein A2033_09000 [Bacteroidetes bacterium GWA2_31_9]